MTQFNKWITILFILIISSGGAIYAQNTQQSREELEKRKRELQLEIEEASKALKNTKKSSRESLAQLRVLKNKIELRSKLINNINSEINFINGDINKAQRDIKTLERDLDTLKKQYADLIVYAYKNRSSYAMLNFVFSAESFNDAVKRYEYLRQYREYRRRQAGTIVETQEQLQTKIENLKNQKDKRSLTLKTEQEQRNTLEKDKEEKDVVFNKLKAREKELTADLNKKKKDAAKVQAAVRAVIRREIEEARKKAAAEELARKKAAEAERKRKEEAAKKLAAQKAADNKSNEANNTTVAANPRAKEAAPEKPVDDDKPTRSINVLEATPEALALSENFEANKGKLPWPVANGVITGFFGRHRHPVIETIWMNNDGLIIATPKNEPVRAVFNGVVVNVYSAAGVGFAVLINHGKYFTNYVHLQSLRVKKGDKVTTGTILGTALTNEDNTGEIEFQVWRDINLQNPQPWILPK